MLTIKILITEERFDEQKQEFIDPEYEILQLEHSLLSISKWESKWCKPFLAKEDKTNEEILDYIKCMTITKNVNPYVYTCLSYENIRQIESYIDYPMTATKISHNGTSRNNREIITSEIIYYWMITLNIPFECQKWPIQRLLTLIKVCNIRNSPTKKMSREEIVRQYAAVNESRKKALNTKG